MKGDVTGNAPVEHELLGLFAYRLLGRTRVFVESSSGRCA